MRDEQKTKQQIIEELVTLRQSFSELEKLVSQQQAEQVALQQQTQREQLIAQIAGRIRQSLDLTEILNIAVQEIQKFLQAERVFVHRFQADWSGVVTVESTAENITSILGQTITDSYFADSNRRKFYEQNRIQAIADIYTADLCARQVDLLAGLEIRANLVVPILQNEQLWGLLIVNQCQKPRQWQEWEIDSLVQLATQLSVALQQSQLYQRTQHLWQREQALNRVIQSIRNCLGLETIFSTAVKEIAQLIPAQQAVIVQYLPQQQIWLHITEYRQNSNLSTALGTSIPDIGNQVTKRLKRLEIVQLEDPSCCSDEINRQLAETSGGTWLLVPLHFNSQIWGSLSLLRNKQSLPWYNEDIELAKTVAEQLSIAIEQSTLLAQLQTELMERQQAEAAVQQKQNIAQKIVETTPDIIYIYDLIEQRNVYINHQMLEILGYSSGAVQSMKEKVLPSLIHPDDINRINAHLQTFQTLQDEEVIEIEYRMKHADGQWRWLHSRECVFTRDRNGLSVQILGTAIDISARKKAELALWETQQHLQTILDNSPAVIYLIDSQNKHILGNRSYANLLSTTPETLIGKSIYEVWPSEVADTFATNNQQVFQENQAIEVEETVTHAEEVHTYITIKFPLHDANGIPYAVCGISRDITERKQAQEKIHEQAALIDVATDAIIVHDLEKRILFWSRGAEYLYGWTREESLGKKTDEFYCRAAASQLLEGLNTTGATGSWQGELEQVTKSGREIIVSSRWTLVQNQFGQTQSILIVNTDITEKKQLEQQFLRAQRLESIGTLASGIAHDLNNLFSPILMSLELLEKKFSDLQTQTLLKMLYTNVQRGADLIKQVLSFAKGVSSKRIIFQLKHIFAEIQYIIQQTFPKSIEFTTEFPLDLWSVCADPTQLQQVLMNLCINARDAMPYGGSLKISAANQFIDEFSAQKYFEAKVGYYVTVSVIDTGIGIAPEVLERIFEPFFTTKEIGKGTGLGLSTVMGIVKTYGGFINVESLVGQGSKFQIYFPAFTDTQHQQPLTEDYELLKGNGEVVLVVDDELSLQQITQTSLSNYNYQMLSANNGVEAISVYVEHKNKISAALIDLMMPDMDGIITIRTLQKINPHLKIIAMSGLATNEKIAEATSAGVKAFLPKPFTLSELLTTLSLLLNQN
ncbi:PAS domain S-box protein [Nostoc sp. CALU 1950]|uniref:PAS domain S-box protein n=1 Tax=Nostoc sp. CALU 1950 TaxID=3104321 RepID=UPI003EBDE671